MIYEQREAAARQIADYLMLAFNNTEAQVMVGGAVAISTAKQGLALKQAVYDHLGIPSFLANGGTRDIGYGMDANFYIMIPG